MQGKGWTPLTVAGANAHSAVAEFPGWLDVRKRLLSCPLAAPQVGLLVKT